MAVCEFTLCTHDSVQPTWYEGLDNLDKPSVRPGIASLELFGTTERIVTALSSLSEEHLGHFVTRKIKPTDRPWTPRSTNGFLDPSQDAPNRFPLMLPRRGLHAWPVEVLRQLLTSRWVALNADTVACGYQDKDSLVGAWGFHVASAIMAFWDSNSFIRTIHRAKHDRIVSVPRDRLGKPPTAGEALVSRRAVGITKETSSWGPALQAVS